MSTVASDLQFVFGQRIRAERERQGISQAELARRLDMHQPDLCDLEKGRHSATLETVERIAIQLAVPPSTLLNSPQPTA